jgi:hypothetical protein
MAHSEWEAIRDNISYAGIRSIYPPLAQIVFRAAHALAPGSVLAMKIIVIGFDLLAYGFVILTLRARGDCRRESILYGWNLGDQSLRRSGHIDAVLRRRLLNLLLFA